MADSNLRPDGDEFDEDLSMEAKSETARSMVNNVLSKTGFSWADIVRFRAKIETVKTGETVTFVESDGDQAGEIVQAMIQSVDWKVNEPKRIALQIKTRDQPVEDDSDDGDSDPDTDAEPVAELPKIDWGETETGEEEFEDELKADDSGEADSHSDAPLEPNSNVHRVLSALAVHLLLDDDDTDVVNGASSAMVFTTEERIRGITGAELLSAFDLDLTSEQVSKSLYILRNSGDVKSVSKDGNSYRHVIAQQGIDALNTIGFSDDFDDFDSIDEIGADERDFGRRGGRGEGPPRKSSGTRKHKREIGREEPDVDSPKPIKKGTRIHEVLTMLKEIEEKYGDDQWVTVNGLYENAEFDHDFPNRDAMSTAASDLFLKHGQCVRRQIDGVGTPLEYKISESGKAEIKRIGKADY